MKYKLETKINLAHIPTSLKKPIGTRNNFERPSNGYESAPGHPEIGWQCCVCHKIVISTKTCKCGHYKCLRCDV